MSRLTGQVLKDRYRVIEFLSEGGMAEVYKVWDKQRSVHLAMKVLHPKLAQHENFLKDFRNEAKTLAELQHPSIVRFYGIENTREHVFLLMDFIEGSSLRDRLANAKRPLNTQFILKAVQQICTALNFAHQNGIVHCDIKPANILINQKGAALVSDFGIARLMGARSARDSASSVGTPAYMAPEQIRGEQLTPETDIYALGIVLFEMLSGGKRPFTGKMAKDASRSTRERIRWEHQFLSPPPLRMYNPDLTSELEAVVMRCLDKDPRNRFANSLELLSALEQAIGRYQDVTESKVEIDETRRPQFDKTRRPPRRGNIFIPVVAGFLIVTFLVLIGLDVITIPTASNDPSDPTRASAYSLETLPLADMNDLPFQMRTLETALTLVETQSADLFEGKASSNNLRADLEGRMENPGEQAYPVFLDGSENIVWFFGWCAVSDSMLESNLRNIDIQFQINGKEIPRSEFLEQRIEGRSPSASCIGYSAMLTNWKPGSQTLKTVVLFKESISDGFKRYPEGIRELTYEVMVGNP